jgi:hypothetical protein
MANSRSDADLEYLTQILQGLEEEYPGTRAWDESPFKWVIAQPSATKGSIARQLVRAWGNLHGIFPKQVSIGNQLYLDLDGILIQVKFSTLWDTGYYRFQQIRERDYDYCLCFGLAPFDMNAWLIPKPVLDTHVIGTKGQHTGSGSGETWWLEISPRSPEPWLEECGGQLNDVAQQLRELV